LTNREMHIIFLMKTN